MMVPHFLGLGTLLTSGFLAITDAAGGPDYAGIAAVITAVSGLCATVGAIYLGSRKQVTLEKALKELQKDQDGEQP